MISSRTLRLVAAVENSANFFNYNELENDSDCYVVMRSMHDVTLITQAEAAQILGRSVATVSRCLRSGKLHYADERRRLLLRDGLEARFRAVTRPRIDQQMRVSSVATPSPRPAPIHSAVDELPSLAVEYWQRLHDKLSCVLAASPSYWQDGSDPQRLKLFCRVLDELRAQVELEGLVP